MTVEEWRVIRDPLQRAMAAADDLHHALDEALHRAGPLDPRAMRDSVNLLLAALHELRRGLIE